MGHQSWFGPKRGIGEKGIPLIRLWSEPKVGGKKNRECKQQEGRLTQEGKERERRERTPQQQQLELRPSIPSFHPSLPSFPGTSSSSSSSFRSCSFLPFLFQWNERAFIFSAFPFLHPIFLPLLPRLDFYSPIICNTKKREWEWRSKPHKSIWIAYAYLKPTLPSIFLDFTLLGSFSVRVVLFFILLHWSFSLPHFVAIVVENSELHN